MHTRTVRGAIVVGSALCALVLGTVPGLGQTQSQDQLRTQDQTRQRMQTRAWDRQAEDTFSLGRGIGRQLMTQEEWQAHQQKMRTMTAEEREQYREEVHAQMQERAREKGITLPETPRRAGPGRPGSPGGTSGGMGGGMGDGKGGAGKSR